MVVPLAGRVIAAVVGGLLVYTAARSVIVTVIVPRPVGSWLTRWVDRSVSFCYGVASKKIRDHKQRDRVLAGQAATILLLQLVAWLAIFYIGFSLLQWPFSSRGITSAFDLGSTAVFGPNDALGAAQRTIADLAAIAALVTVSLQIAYLPTLYSAFNRRETEVALLNSRAGVPSWGPELLARTYYALGSGVSTIDTLPDLYEAWERWAADVAESHTTYLPLVRFRSPKPMSSWVTALLAVLDSAALILALSPKNAPVVPARLCLRSGFLCFGDVARAMGIDVPAGARPERRDQPQLRRFPGRDSADAQGEFPDRARGRGRVAGLRRLAGQLRAGRLRADLRPRRGARALVRPAAQPASVQIPPIRPPEGRPPK